MFRLFTGFSAFFQGFRFIRRHNLWKYILLPSALSLLVGILVPVGLYKGTSGFLLGLLNDILTGLAGTFHFSYSGLHWSVSGLVRLLTAFLAFVIGIILYRVIASLVIIPFLGPLLNQTEKIHIGRPIEVSLGRDIKNALIGLKISLKFALIGLLVLVISLPLGPFQIIINTLLQGYFLGRSAFDYIFEKEATDPQGRRELVRRHRLQIIGLGLAFFTVLLIPILGVIIAPPAALVGAALNFHRKPDTMS